MDDELYNDMVTSVVPEDIHKTSHLSFEALHVKYMKCHRHAHHMLKSLVEQKETNKALIQRCEISEANVKQLRETVSIMQANFKLLTSVARYEVKQLQSRLQNLQKKVNGRSSSSWQPPAHKQIESLCLNPLETHGRQALEGLLYTRELRWQEDTARPASPTPQDLAVLALNQAHSSFDSHGAKSHTSPNRKRNPVVPHSMPPSSLRSSAPGSATLPPSSANNSQKKTSYDFESLLRLSHAQMLEYVRAHQEDFQRFHKTVLCWLQDQGQSQTESDFVRPSSSSRTGADTRERSTRQNKESKGEASRSSSHTRSESKDSLASKDNKLLSSGNRNQTQLPQGKSQDKRISSHSRSSKPPVETQSNGKVKAGAMSTPPPSSKRVPEPLHHKPEPSTTEPVPPHRDKPSSSNSRVESSAGPNATESRLLKAYSQGVRQQRDNLKEKKAMERSQVREKVNALQVPPRQESESRQKVASSVDERPASRHFASSAAKRDAENRLNSIYSQRAKARLEADKHSSSSSPVVKAPPKSEVTVASLPRPKPDPIPQRISPPPVAPVPAVVALGLRLDEEVEQLDYDELPDASLSPALSLRPLDHEEGEISDSEHEEEEEQTPSVGVSSKSSISTKPAQPQSQVVVSQRRKSPPPPDQVQRTVKRKPSEDAETAASIPSEAIKRRRRISPPSPKKQQQSVLLLTTPTLSICSSNSSRKVTLCRGGHNFTNQQQRSTPGRYGGERYKRTG